MFFLVSFVNTNFIINRSFRRAIKPENIKVSFFAKSLFLKKEVDVIVSEISLDTNK